MKGMNNKKIWALVTASILLAVGIGSSTLAWLSDKTEDVPNVFTVSDIEIKLEETKTDFKMVPGWTIDKDPLMTVKAGSEDCWVFLKVEETGGKVTVDETNYTFDDFIAYRIDEHNWTKLEGNSGNNEAGVYYCYAKDLESDRSIKVLAGGTYKIGSVEYAWEPNQVLTKPEVTKEMMSAIDSTNKPTLTFTGYAVQYWKNNDTTFTANEAWEIINPSGSQ